MIKSSRINSATLRDYSILRLIIGVMFAYVLIAVMSIWAAVALTHETSPQGLRSEALVYRNVVDL